MSEGAVLTRRPGTGRFLALTLLASLIGHGALLAYLERRPAHSAVWVKPVELVMVEVPPPPPAPPPPEKIDKPEPKPKVRPPAIKVAQPKPPPVIDAAPPPPNDAPPPDPVAKPPPLVVGISMSSTTTAGGFAAPVGNTVYGKTADKATAPRDVKAYSAPRYMPASQVDSDPEVLAEVKIPYPAEAKKAGIEGIVTLSIVVDIEGRVVAVKILKGPGFGLNEAAAEAIRGARFKPAMKRGEAVSTEIKYAYTFLLD